MACQNLRSPTRTASVRAGSIAACRRMAIAGVISMIASGCTFGMLTADRCLKYYDEGMTEAAARAGAAGSITEESYGFCVDGRSRADALVGVLRTHGFTTDGPLKHFEVPGGWCLSGKRAVTAQHFAPKQALATVCAIGHASRAFLTGGKLVTGDGREFAILSIFDRRAAVDAAGS